ncbi:hypothetical protein Emag_003000 [Eimeria magna]
MLVLWILRLLLPLAFCGEATGRRATLTAARGSLTLAAISSTPQHPLYPPQQQQQQQQQQQLARPSSAAFRSRATLLHRFNTGSSKSSRDRSSSSSKALDKGPETREAEGERNINARGGLCLRWLAPTAGALLLLLLLRPLRRCCWPHQSKAIPQGHASSSSSSRSSNSRSSSSRSSRESSNPMEEAEPAPSARAFALRHLMLRAGAPTARKPPPDWAPVTFRLRGLPVGLRARQGLCVLMQLAVDTLEDVSVEGFVMEGNEWVGRQQLLHLVCQQYRCEPAVYCSRMRMQSTWGGGPEILALAHALGRPIAVYTLQGSGRTQAASAAVVAPDPMQRTLLRLLQQPRSGLQQQQQQQQQQQREAEVRLCKVFGWREGCQEEPLHLLFVNAGDLEGLRAPGGEANHFVPLHPQPPP